mmetsp:Transcript_7688/g.11041  ORF Transcript_7688/g.11041 Transcript_7688/m.11041 type:complete len:134 (+) Transcript_7688:91-492(+)
MSWHASCLLHYKKSIQNRQFSTSIKFLSPAPFVLVVLRSYRDAFAGVYPSSDARLIGKFPIESLFMGRDDDRKGTNRNHWETTFSYFCCMELLSSLFFPFLGLFSSSSTSRCVPAVVRYLFLLGRPLKAFHDY